MGLTSGRGSRGGARRSGRDGYAGRENDGQRGYTSLVSRDGHGQQRGPAARGGYAGHGGHDGYASNGGYASADGYVSAGVYLGNAGTGGYAHRDGYGTRDGYGYHEPDRYGQQDGYRQTGTDGGRAVPEERAGHGLSAASGRLSAFIRRGGRRGGYRRRAGYGRRRGISVPVIAVVAVLASVAVVAAAAGVNRMLTARPAAADAPAVNTNCTLIVPADPLTAGGLATPYQLTATDPANGPCNEANTGQTAFVQGAVLDPATGTISVYNPLVIDAGTQPAVAPVAPALPAGAVVAVWFGFNGNTLTLAGADQAQALTAPSSATGGPSSPAQNAPSGTAAASGAATATGAPAAGTPAAGTPAAGTPAATAPAGAPGTDPSASPAASGTQPSQPAASPSAPATATAPAAQATPTAAAAAANSAPSMDVPKAAAEAEGAAPLSPANAGSAAGYNATLTRVGGYGSSMASGRSGSSPSAPAVAPSPPDSPQAQDSQPAAGSPPATVSPSAAGSAAGSAPASGSASAQASAGAAATPSAAGDGPAASGTPDAILQQANCVAGQVIGGQFSSFTQMGACNAAAFFRAANAAIRAGKLTVPAPGTASDGMPCLTTRSFALIDQDQSDNVTTQYLAEGNGQTAQDTTANRQAMSGAAQLFNGSDNGLLDFFVDPALGCTPWQVPDLADGGAPAPALPLDELQAARYAGGRGSPAALVPLNDPMTLDNNGQLSRAKTNTYRSLVDMRPLPAGQSPAAYCLDMERIQGKRLQQDVNLLTGRAGPAPDAANSLFTFLAMRLQQSFGNLGCGSFGIRNVVSTTADASGVVVAACFLYQVAPVTPGPGNPMGAAATCPATTATSPSDPAGQPGADSGSPGPGSSASASAPAASPTPSSSTRQRHYRRHHWW